MTAPKRQDISPQAKNLIKQIYTHSAVGCCWHVVLDDNNWDSIEFSKEWARDNAGSDSEFPCMTKGACQKLADLDVTGSILKRARDAAFREMHEGK